METVLVKDCNCCNSRNRPARLSITHKFSSVHGVGEARQLAPHDRIAGGGGGIAGAGEITADPGDLERGHLANPEHGELGDLQSIRRDDAEPALRYRSDAADRKQALPCCACVAFRSIIFCPTPIA